MSGPGLLNPYVLQVGVRTAHTKKELAAAEKKQKELAEARRRLAERKERNPFDVNFDEEMDDEPVAAGRDTVVPPNEHAVEKSAEESDEEERQTPPEAEKLAKEVQEQAEQAALKAPDLEHVPWNFKTKESGLSSEETAVMRTIIDNVIHFCCHTTKQMFYECALKDGTFVNNTRTELQKIRHEEQDWCMWIAASNTTRTVRCNWKDEHATAHAILRSITHLHPITVRYLISEFLQKTSALHLQQILRVCLKAEIELYRDKMNEWDCRIYQYILHYSDVCNEIVNVFMRLGSDIVILEWMSDWTALLYFCQYTRGPFYYFLHPQTINNSKFVRSYTCAQQTIVCCCDSIISLSSLSESDFLYLIKEAWKPSISYTHVEVNDAQINKFEKTRKCVEIHFLYSQHKYWTRSTRKRTNRTTKMFDDPSFPLLTKASELIAGSFWSNLKDEWRNKGYFGYDFVPNSFSIDSQHLPILQNTEAFGYSSSKYCRNCPQQAQIPANTNPYILQLGVPIDDDVWHDNAGKDESDKESDEKSDEEDVEKMLQDFDALFHTKTKAKESQNLPQNVHYVEGNVVEQRGNVYQAVSAKHEPPVDDGAKHEPPVDDNAVLSNVKDIELKALGFTNSEISTIHRCPSKNLDRLMKKSEVKSLSRLIQEITELENILSHKYKITKPQDKQDEAENMRKNIDVPSKWLKTPPASGAEATESQRNKAHKFKTRDEKNQEFVQTKLALKRMKASQIRVRLLRDCDTIQVARLISKQVSNDVPAQADGDLGEQDFLVFGHSNDDAAMDVESDEEDEAGMDFRPDDEAGMNVERGWMNTLAIVKQALDNQPDFSVDMFDVLKQQGPASNADRRMQVQETLEAAQKQNEKLAQEKEDEMQKQKEKLAKEKEEEMQKQKEKLAKEKEEEMLDLRGYQVVDRQRRENRLLPNGQLRQRAPPTIWDVYEQKKADILQENYLKKISGKPQSESHKSPDSEAEPDIKQLLLRFQRQTDQKFMNRMKGNEEDTQITGGGHAQFVRRLITQAQQAIQRGYEVRGGFAQQTSDQNKQLQALRESIQDEKNFIARKKKLEKQIAREEIVVKDLENLQASLQKQKESFGKAIDKVKSAQNAMSEEQALEVRRRAASFLKPVAKPRMYLKFKCFACLFTCQTCTELVEHFHTVEHEMTEHTNDEDNDDDDDDDADEHDEDDEAMEASNVVAATKHDVNPRQPQRFRPRHLRGGQGAAGDHSNSDESDHEADGDQPEMLSEDQKQALHDAKITHQRAADKQAIENLKEKNRLEKEEKARLRHDQDKILRQKRIDLEHAIIVARYYQILEEDKLRKARLTRQIDELKTQISRDAQNLRRLTDETKQMTNEEENENARRGKESSIMELSLSQTLLKQDLRTAEELVDQDIHFERFCSQFQSDMGKPIWLDSYRSDVIWDNDAHRHGGKRNGKRWKTAPSQLARPPKAKGKSNQGGKWWNNAEYDDGHDDDPIENDHEEDDTP